MKHSAEKVTTNATFTFGVFGFVGVYTKTRIQIPMIYTHRFIRGALAMGASKNEISLIRSLITETINFGRAASFLEYFFALDRTST